MTSFRHYEILLPTRYNDGTPVEPEIIEASIEEVALRFGGVTFQPENLQGVWIREGQRFEDTNVRLTIDVEDTPGNTSFFADLKIALKARFDQLDIWIVSYEIRIT